MYKYSLSSIYKPSPSLPSVGLPKIIFPLLLFCAFLLLFLSLLSSLAKNMKGQYNHDTNCCRHKVSFLSSSPNKSHNSINNNNHPQIRPPHIPSFLDYQPNPFVKSEGSSSRFIHDSLLMKTIHNQQDTNHDKNNNNERSCSGSSSRSFSEVEAMKAKIIAHPQYSTLLRVYIDCQKIGAPPEVVERLVASQQQFEARQRCSGSSRDIESKDPELDQFMEAYYNMLVKYREELTRPIQEAMGFIRSIEAQLKTLCQTPISLCNSSEEKRGGMGSSEDDQENSSGGETELAKVDPGAEDRYLKNHLLRKYSGYLSSLKQELSKKKKKGKLPREARQKLLTWWELHYRWPYPSETEKAALAETTGLDQKQINNWFINQRKRHWKASEDMQFTVMDGLHPQSAAAAALYMDGHYMAGGPYCL